MSNTLYIISAMIILTLSTWLDKLLSTLHISKKAFLAVAFISLLLTPISVNIYDTDISPLSVILPAVTFIFAVTGKQYSFFNATAAEIILTIFGCALLYLFPQSSGSTTVPLLAIIAGLLFYRKPLLALNVTLTFPYIIYIVSLFADFFFFMGNNSPNQTETLFVQICGAAVCIFSVYLVQTAMALRSKYLVRSGGHDE